MLIFGILLVSVSIFLAFFGPYVSPYDPVMTTGEKSLLPPPSLMQVPNLIVEAISGKLTKPVHWLGTDNSGLDILSRIMCAPRTDITIGLAATCLSVILGTLLGLYAGYYRNWASEILMRVSDVSQSFPVFIVAMILVSMSGRNTANIILALMLVYIPIYIRLTRSRVMTVRERPFVEAARAMGNSEMSIAFRHVLPNSLTPSLIQASVNVGWAILLTSGLSFVGAGVRPPTPEWGSMIALGSDFLVLGDWWPSVFPGVAISVVVFGYAIVGNALEEAYGTD